MPVAAANASARGVAVSSSSVAWKRSTRTGPPWASEASTRSARGRHGVEGEPQAVRLRKGVHREIRDGGHGTQEVQVHVSSRIVEQVSIGIGEDAEEQPRRRVPGPGEDPVVAFLSELVVVALAAEERVVAGATEETVVATEAVERVVARAAVDPIAPLGAPQRVVAGPAIEDRHEVVAPLREVRHVEALHAALELDPVVAAEAGDADLLHEGTLRRVAPREEECAPVVEDLHGARIDGLPHQDHVVAIRPVDHEDVGGVVVVRFALGGVAEVAVDAVAGDGVGGVHVGAEEVDPRAAEHHVGAVLAFQRVRVGAAPHLVVAAAAIEIVEAVAAEDAVGTARDRRLGAGAVARASQDVAQDRVVAFVAEEELDAEIPTEDVVVEAAVELIAAP